MRARDYYLSVWRDFDATKRLILVSGPRQSGKTTLAKSIGGGEASWLCFNYEIPRDRQLLRDNPAFFEKVDRAGGGKRR